ncbi:integral membrane protein [Clathrospora elynae]|uniref:Integral membrane protein n=1 Tax=Clathrospora elynae TaxID=706981 RepID=A0A6A5SVM9_9PLEO|nr:integral membrane protein [Clathrospora elynae]
MSVKFEKETVMTTGAVADAASKGKDDLLHEVGKALTQGGGPNGYLAAYLKQLQSNPLRTKMLTSGTLSGLQEFLASWIAHDRTKSGNYFTSRVPKMAIYGALISAPLGHVLISALQKVFQGRKSLKAKVLQILVSNLIIAPIQNSVYLVSMALIAGARTFHQVKATVKAGFWPVMKVSWVVSPISLAFAQQFLPETTWVPFFNIIGFIIGTYINAHTKKKRLAALRRKHYGDGGSGSGRNQGPVGGRPGDEYGRPGDRPIDRPLDRPIDRADDRSRY